MHDILMCIGGEAPKYYPFSRKFSDIIAVDGGVLLCKQWDISPSMIVGDMDTVSCETARMLFPHAKYIILPQDKAETDTEAALAQIPSHTTHVTIAGGGGGREDHFISLQVLFFRQYSYHMRLVTQNYVYEKITTRFLYYGRKGSIISFFPLANVCKMSSKGLRWSLDKEHWSIGDHGVSNELCDSSCTVEIHEGCVLAVYAREDARSGYI